MTSWSKVVTAGATPFLPQSLPQVNFERKGMMPQAGAPVAKRRFVLENTHETRMAALSIYNELTEENLSENQIQVDSYDPVNGLAILARHRDLPEDQLSYLRGVIIDLNNRIILNFSGRELPVIQVNQSLEAALKELNVSKDKVEFRKGLQGLTLNFFKHNGQVLVSSNTNLNILNAKFDKYRVSEMLEQTGVDYKKFFPENEKQGHYVHSFLLVHKVFAKAMKDATEKPFLTYIYSAPDSTGEHTDLDIEKRLKPMTKPWGEGGAYTRPVMDFQTASDWLDHGVFSKMKMDDRIAYLRGAPNGLSSIPENLRQGEHLYLIARDGDQIREYIVESVSHSWRQDKIFPDLNFSVNFYDAIFSNPFNPSVTPSLDALLQEEKKMPILYWPSWLPGAEPRSKPVYNAFAALLLAAPFIRHQEVFTEYQAYLTGVDKLVQWLPQYNPSVVSAARMSDNMKLKVNSVLSAIQKTLKPVEAAQYKSQLGQLLTKTDSKVLRQIIILVNSL